METLPPSARRQTFKNLDYGFALVRLCDVITNTGKGPTSLYKSWEKEEMREGQKNMRRRGRDGMPTWSDP